MENKVCFIIFAHCNLQNKEDIQDMICNIKQFHSNCDFIINHPTIQHEKIFTRYIVGQVGTSPFIYGAFREIIEKLTLQKINEFSHFCLVSANQYFISNISFEKDINYVQFFNSPNWSSFYFGKDTPNIYIENALQQECGKWDSKLMYEEFLLKTPMCSNWECAALTKETIIECKNNFHLADKYYPNCDLISSYPGYMALKTNQQWKFPAFFGTFDPSCPNKNWIITIDQIKQKKSEGYYSVKRVNYNKNCKIKEFIRKNYYVS